MRMQVMYVSLNTLTIAGVSGVLSGIAVSSAAQFFAFWFSLLLISLAAAYLGLLLAVTFSDFRVGRAPPLCTGATCHALSPAPSYQPCHACPASPLPRTGM